MTNKFAGGIFSTEIWPLIFRGKKIGRKKFPCQICLSFDLLVKQLFSFKKNIKKFSKYLMLFLKKQIIFLFFLFFKKHLSFREENEILSLTFEYIRTYVLTKNNTIGTGPQCGKLWNFHMKMSSLIIFCLLDSKTYQNENKNIFWLNLTSLSTFYSTPKFLFFFIWWNYMFFGVRRKKMGGYGLTSLVWIG